MSIGADAFLKKHKINQRDILYIVKDDRKTALVLNNGTRVYTIIPAKRFQELMPDSLVSVNKGVLLAREHIVSIENGVYTVTDGSEHKGRVRTPGQHKRNRDIIVRQPADYSVMDKLKKSFSVLEKMPLPCCIIELVFDENGHGFDFVFRFGNDKMAELERKSLDEILDHSFYEIFAGGNKKSILTYAEVALNGTSAVVEKYREDVGKNFRIYCFQPAPNFCACLMVPID